MEDFYHPSDETIPVFPPFVRGKKRNSLVRWNPFHAIRLPCFKVNFFKCFFFQLETYFHVQPWFAGLGFFLSALDLPEQHFNMLGSKLLPSFPYSRSEEKRFWKKLELNSGRRASQETTQITWLGLHVQKLGQTCRGDENTKMFLVKRWPLGFLGKYVF